MFTRMKTQDLRGGALAYVLWLIESGVQHKRSSSMYFFPRGKREMLKSAWKPWDNRDQAFDLLDAYGLCVWKDSEGWHAGAYGETDELSVFVDAPTPELAICLAVIAKRAGMEVDVSNSLLNAELPETKKKRRTADVV